MVQALVSCRLDYCDSVLRHLGKTDVPIAVGSERGHPSGYSYSPCLALCHPRLVSVILNIRKTVEIILVCLTTAAPVIFNWRRPNKCTNELTNSTFRPHNVGATSTSASTSRLRRSFIGRCLAFRHSYLADDCRLVADARERRLRSTASRTCVVTRT